MGNILDLREIITDYICCMKKDLNRENFFLLLILPPIIVTICTVVILYQVNIPAIDNLDSSRNIVTQISNLVGNILLICSILIPLLINLLMIVYYGVEKIERNYSDLIEQKHRIETEDNLDLSVELKLKFQIIKLKYKFLCHINSTVSMSVVLSVIILIFCLLYNIYSSKLWIYGISFLMTLVIINLFVIIRRIHILIKNDLEKNTENVKAILLEIS